MRAFLAVSAIALGLSACASQSSPPAQPAAAAPAAPVSAAKAPQCWNGDLGAFQEIGTQASIAGVAVSCKATSDGKNAQWMGAAH